MCMVKLPLPSTAGAVTDEKRGCRRRCSAFDVVLSVETLRPPLSRAAGSGQRAWQPVYWAYVIKPAGQPARLQSAKVRAEPLQGAAPRSWWRVGLREFDNFSCWLRGGQKKPARAAPTARHDRPQSRQAQGKARQG